MAVVPADVPPPLAAGPPTAPSVQMRASEPLTAPVADPSPPGPRRPRGSGPLSAPPPSTPPGQAPSALAVASPPEHPLVPPPTSDSPPALPPLRVQTFPRSFLPSRLPLPRSRTPFPLPSSITLRLPPPRRQPSSRILPP
ncbi:putative basic proline-rich protein-like [Iris pallida]|uniref:Basic proline-rich protein-like n=1 Tax=Iris pallida TaxID=29817 RepID=A0AAX6HIC3_IRIPA|nr:putative basic proline-rich protein-like [Iris pallida]